MYAESFSRVTHLSVEPDDIIILFPVNPVLFAPEQVKGEYRWCTHPNGQPIPGTFTEGDVVEPKNCQFYRDFRYNCAADGNFEVDWDCTRYITCSNGNAHLCKCPAKQAWDTTLGICNWIAQVPRCGKAP